MPRMYLFCRHKCTDVLKGRLPNRIPSKHQKSSLWLSVEGIVVTHFGHASSKEPNKGQEKCKKEYPCDFVVPRMVSMEGRDNEGADNGEPKLP